MTFWHSPPLPSRVGGPTRTSNLSPFATLLADVPISIEFLGVLLACCLASVLLAEVQRRTTSKLVSSPTVNQPPARLHDLPSSPPSPDDNAQSAYLKCFPDLTTSAAEASEGERKQMVEDKQLYWKLQCVEEHPDVATEARQRLLGLFDKTIAEASGDPSSTVLSIPHYDRVQLRSFLSKSHHSAATRFESYLRRRKTGGPREMFPNPDFAREWLRLAAVIKYVDGGWIGGILNAGRGRAACSGGNEGDDGRLERRAGKMAWQVISEEYGDGDLEKNHVHLYESLLTELGIAIGTTASTCPGNVRGFDGLPDDQGVPRCWEAAVAQQCIGLLASTDDFFPEALGFNMAYESLPYHLLVSAHELKELRINNYYFAIHVTIDNADSGHSAMARLAVERYLEGVRERDGIEAMEKIWKRVQAGYVLAEGLPTTPSGPREFEQYTLRDGSDVWRPRNISSSPTTPESNLVRVVVRKSTAANKMHCTSRMNIAGQTVEEWLEPTTLTDPKALAFLRALADRRPYVIPGEPLRSRLVRDMEWGGRMFGAFSRGETEVVREWIYSLAPHLSSEGAYERFLGEPVCPGLLDQQIGYHQLSSDHPSAYQGAIPLLDTILYSSSIIDTASSHIDRFLPIWFTSLVLLERFPLSPSRFASPLGMTVLRLIRSQLGFGALHRPEDICAGTDDVGLGAPLDIHGLWEIGEQIVQRPVNVFTLVGNCDHKPTRGLCETLLTLRQKPYASSPSLIGITLSLSRRLHASEAIQQSLDTVSQSAVQRIAQEEERAIVDYVQSLGTDGKAQSWTKEFCLGYAWATNQVKMLYNSD